MRVGFVVLALVLGACSGDGLTGAASAQAVLKARFDTPDRTDCSVAGSAVAIGTFRDPDPVSVMDGSRGELGTYRIACRVAELGGGAFAVEGSMTADEHVLFAIKGTFPTTTDASGFKAESVTVSNGDRGSGFAAFTEADGECTVLYNTDKQGVAAGRAWAEVTCAKATKDPAAAGTGSGTCITIAQFRFENCATK